MISVWCMQIEDRDLAVSWITSKMRRVAKNDEIAFPPDILPATGLVAKEDGKTLAVCTLYLDKTSAVAVAGFCAANPGNLPHQSFEAVKRILAVMPTYAKECGAKHLLTTFGNRGINKICDFLNYTTGDTGIEHKYMKL